MNMSFKNIILLLIFVLILFSSINFICAVDLNNSSISEITNDNHLNNNFDDIIAINECDELDNEILEDEGTENVLDEGYVIYVGSHNKTETGNGTEDNPFSTLKYACDNVSGQDIVTLKIFNGTYYLGSHLQFNTSNLNIKGINGNVIVTYLYDSDEMENHGEAFGLTSALSNFTISNIIFDGRNRSSYDAFWGPEVYYEMMGEEGSYQSFFLPFYGYANIGTFNNCSFLFGNYNTRLTGASEYKSKFINCYFDVTNDWHFLFYGGQFRDEDGAMLAGFNDVTGDGPQFKYCSFNLPNIDKLVASIHLPYTISITNAWFGQNELPAYVGPFSGDAIVKPGGSYDWDWTIPVNKYAIFSVSENYLGNNQFEIVGKLTWNGTDSQEGMENFQPMTVKLSSDTGEIATTAILINGTFKANYTSQATINKITATLDSQPLELEFYSVNISADAPSIYYGQDQNLTLNFTQPIDATIVLTISNENYNESYEIYVNNKDSIVYTIYDTLKEGIYTVDIHLNDNKYYGENSTTLTISKISNYLFDVIIPSEAKIGENATITLTLPEDVDGNVTIKFGNNIKILDANQTMTIDFNNLNATTYDINVSYSGSDKYAAKEKMDSITIDKADSNVNIDDIAFTYGDVITIPFTVTNASGVNVRVLNKDGEEITTATSDGNEFTLETLPAGEYTLEVTTIVDEKNYYDFTADNIVLTINKADSSLTLNDSYEFIYGQDAIINVVTENSTGDVIVSFNQLAVSVSGNEITLPALNGGKYTLTVTTNVDENHNNVTKSATIIINKTIPLVDVVVEPVENITTKDNVTLTISLPSDAIGEVTVKINGKKVDSISANETITINLNNQPAGDNIVDIVYSGDQNYESNITTKEFTVYKSETSITANPIVFEEGNTSTIEIDIFNIGSGFILVDVEGKKFYGDINSGKATVLIDGLVAGNYTANIIFAGDEKFNKATGTVAVNVTPTVDIIGQLNESIKELNNTIEAQKEQINILNDTVSAQNSTIESQAEKINNLTETVVAQNNAIESQKAEIESLNNTVISQNSTIESQAEKISNLTETVAIQNNTIESQKAEIDSLNSTVISQNSTIESQTKEINDLNATVNNQTSTIESQKEQIGNLNKQIDKKDVVIVVDQTFTRSAVDYTAGERGGMFYAILKDSDGNVLANKTVQIAVNGPIYNVTTDDQGRAGLRVNLANANTYTYALSFQGDDEYNAAPIASSKLTVTKKKTTIAASNKVFKAKTKSKKISITLKTVKNQYDKKTYLKSGKKVTLKVNGKTYTAKINKKGVAKFTIKITKKGKYTAKIKFAGDATYKASSKTIKIRIK